MFDNKFYAVIWRLFYAVGQQKAGSLVLCLLCWGEVFLDPSTCQESRPIGDVTQLQARTHAHVSDPINP